MSFSLFGGSNYILFEKLPVNKENDAHFRFIKENEKYFNHVTTQWNYSVDKVGLINGLKQAFQNFSSQGSETLESDLLLGDIALYLYNLSDSSYFETAEKYFKKAIKSEPLDYRAFWFLANLYNAGRNHESAIGYFAMAQTRLPKVEPALFWGQYASAAASACMPSNSLFAMDKARSILGQPSDFKKKYGQILHTKIVEVNSAGTYSNNDLWSYTEGDKYIFTSRPLGMMVSVYPDCAQRPSGCP